MRKILSLTVLFFVFFSGTPRESMSRNIKPEVKEVALGHDLIESLYTLKEIINEKDSIIVSGD